MKRLQPVANEICRLQSYAASKRPGLKNRRRGFGFPDQCGVSGTAAAVPDSDCTKFTASGNAAAIAGLSIGSFHSRDFPQLTPPCAVREAGFLCLRPMEPRGVESH